MVILLFVGSIANAVTTATLATAEAEPLQEDQTFVAAIELDDGTIDCNFKVLADGTVMVVGDGTKAGPRAIDINAQGALTIPATVSYLGTEYTVTQIGSYAFGNDDKNLACSGLTAVLFPNTIDTIGDRAFFYCSGLEQVNIPANVSLIKQYAFCRALGLKKVVFEGDAPSTESYIFTGGGVEVEQVIYHGKKLLNQDALFNSQAVAKPSYYYSVDFYQNQAAVTDDQPFSKIIVSENTRYIDINKQLTAPLLYLGNVPDFPASTNLWIFVNAVGDYSAQISDSCAVYAQWSDYQDLSLGSFALKSSEAYTGKPLPFAQVKVLDLLGMVPNYLTAYERLNSSGDWELTSDFTSPGKIRATVYGQEPYFGQIQKTCTIEVKLSSVFYHPIQNTLPDGTVSTVLCQFRLTAVDSVNNTGTVVVTSTNDSDGRSTKAVSPTTAGAIVIPDDIVVFDQTYRTVGISASAFGWSSALDSTACTDITQITIPQSITQPGNSIGSNAFRACSKLSRVIFSGNASAPDFGSMAFYDAPITEVIYLGDKEKQNGINLFPTNPARYYTITFYERFETVGEPQSVLGKVTIKDTVPLALVPNISAYSDGVYGNAAPGYPSWPINDSDKPGIKSKAPAWFYHDETDDDISLPMTAPLTDSTYAYCIQAEDAFTLDDAIVLGLTRDQVFTYTGEPVYNPANLIVCTATGGKLTLDTDYSLLYEREYIPNSNQWVPETDFIDAGKLHVTITGKGNYSESRTIPFEIKAVVSEVGTTFKVKIPLINVDGSQSTVDCQFKVTAAYPGKYTVTVYGSDGNNTTKAIARLTAGKLIIPEKVRFIGLDYTVTELAPYAFGGVTINNTVNSCPNITEVVLPPTVTVLGQYSLAGMTGLTRANVPSAVTSSTNAFQGDTKLAAVVLEDGLKSISASSFSGCTDLVDIQIPNTVTTIGSGAFTNCKSLQEISIPGAVTSMPSAFSGCSKLQKVTLSSGITKISSSAFSGCSALKQIVLPSTITTIEASAFTNTGLTELVLPSSINTLGSACFSSCLSLQKVIFQGDASNINFTLPFLSSNAIKTVIFEGKIAANVALLFVATADLYITVDFYANSSALNQGQQLGSATVKLGTIYRDITSNANGSSSVYQGLIPAYPNGSNIWEFSGKPVLNKGITDSGYAFAKLIDIYDLSEAVMTFSNGYRYTGNDVDPFRNGTGVVVLASGQELTRDLDFTTTFQRRNQDGDWVDTSDIKSRNGVQVTATAIPGSQYHGQVKGIYTITDYLVGSTFSHLSSSGHQITYRVLTVGDELVPGTVQVGNGYSTSPAIEANASGDLQIAATPTDPNGFPYTTTEVGDYALYRRMGLTSVIIPSTVQKIGTQAFAYVSDRNDTQVSNLQTVVFENNLETTDIASDAFLNCNRINTIIYDSKKGSYNSFGAAWANISRYYAVRYYASKADFDRGNVQAKMLLLEDAYVFSPGLNQRYQGGVYPVSDDLPRLDSGYEWRYEPLALGADQIVNNSLYAYARLVDDHSFVVQVPLLVGSTQTMVDCTFNVIYDQVSDLPTAYASVGVGTDGSPAVDSSLHGTLQIPQTVEGPDGDIYIVSQLASSAFGSLDTQLAAQLSAVNLPASVTTIGQSAFLNCAYLTSIGFTVDSQLDSIGPSAFAGASNLVNIELPQTVTQIQTAAFERSGLKYIKIPFSVQTLGIRAFDSCSALTEVVFGGAMSLNLPLLDSGQLRPGATPPDTTSNVSKLKLIENYSFASCISLKRLVFDADVSKLVVDANAFVGATSVETVVYGDKRNSFVFKDAAPTVYITVSYFASQQDINQHRRQSYACVAPGATINGLASGYKYAGSVPALAEHYQWIYAHDPAVALADSTYIYSAKQRFNIDISEVDPAFTFNFNVDGKPVADAAFDDTVSLTLSANGAFSSIQLEITDAATSETLVQTKESGATFKMPGNAVKVSVSPQMDLALYKGSSTGTLTHVKTVGYDQMRSWATINQATYSSWDSYVDRNLTTVGSAVPLASLLAQAGIDFRSGDTLLVERAGTTVKTTISYDKLFSKGRQYFPHIIQDDPSDSVEVQPVLALSSATKRVSVQDDPEYAQSSVTPDMSGMYQLFYGQTIEDFYLKNDTSTKNSFNKITKITVLSDSTKMDTVSYDGIKDQYAYTGSPITINPKPLLTNPEGKPMVEGIDYEVSYQDNIAAGTGHFLATGLGAYSGTLDVSFRILRNQAIAGENRHQTAGLIASETYPNGSAGAIIAYSGNFPDALSASALAGITDYPILLSETDQLPKHTQTALETLSAGQAAFSIIIVGDARSISNNVETKLKALYGANNISRLAGSDRYKTSQEIYFYSNLVQSLSENVSWSKTAIVASGENFPDALSVSPYAVYTHSPIFLSGNTQISDEVLSNIKNGGFQRVLVIGSEATIGKAVYASLQELVGSPNVIRLGGSNRYQTAALIANWEIQDAGMTCHKSAVATGQNFPDALTGSVLLGKSGSVLLLTSADNFATFDLLTQNSASVNHLRFLGGTDSVNNATRQVAIQRLAWSIKL